MAPAARTRIRILPSRSVVIDGRPVGEGREVEVPAGPAETLIADGYAESAAKPARTAPKRKQPTPAPPRKPLTVEALMEGEGDRG